MRGVAPILPALLIVALACSGGSPAASPAPTSSPSPKATATGRPPQPPSPVTPRPGAAASISLIPNEGTCGAAPDLTGSGFGAGTPVVVLRWVSIFDSPVPIASATADSNGEFEVRIPPADVIFCQPGLEAVLEVRPQARADEFAGGWPRAVFRVPSKPLVLEPSRIRCDQLIRVSGDDFPPGAQVAIMFGEADPFAHNFAELATVTADAGGSVSVEVRPLLPPDCRGGEFAIYTFVRDQRTEFSEPRRKAIVIVGGS